MIAYKTLAQPSQIEYSMRKSRFIARCFSIESEAQAVGRLDEIRRQHYDATHNCYAYRLGERGEQGKCSDDGEPQGTAGRPILEVLARQEITNALCVVTRYFGGILLGAGGLTRAYGRACTLAVEAAGIAQLRKYTRIEIKTSYSAWQGLQAFLTKQGIRAWQAEYAQEVICAFWLQSSREVEVLALAGDNFYGSAAIRVLTRAIRADDT